MKLMYGDRYAVDMQDTLVYVTIDPAGGTSPENATPRTDKWGFAVAAVTSDSKYFILDCFAEHMTEATFMDKLWSLDAQYHPYRIGIEKTQHLDAYIRLEFIRKQRFLNLVKLEPKGRKKERRIQALSAILPHMYFSSKIHATIQHDMRRYYTEMEHGDDHLDALAYMLDIAVAPTANMLSEQREIRHAADNREALSHIPEYQRAEWQQWVKMEKQLKHGRTVSEEFMSQYDY